MVSFEKALEVVLKHEGGYSNNPHDRGGATKWGITKKVYTKFLGKVRISDARMRKMEMYECKQIYRQNYWKWCGLNKLISQLIATLIFDQAVNTGCKSAIKRAQRSINHCMRKDLRIDGIMGSQTMRALRCVDPHQFALDYFRRAQLHYVSIVVRTPLQSEFLKGWLNRTYSLLALTIEDLEKRYA